MEKPSIKYSGVFNELSDKSSKSYFETKFYIGEIKRLLDKYSEKKVIDILMSGNVFQKPFIKELIISIKNPK